MSVQHHSVWIALGSMDGTTRVMTPASLNASASALATYTYGTCLNASATFTIETGASLVGSFVVETTNDRRAEDPQTVNSAQWSTVVSLAVSASTFSGGATNYTVTWQNGAKYTRVRWVFTSGTGTGYAFLHGVAG